MKDYKFLSHTADIRMQVVGDTLAELFEASVSGMNEMLSPGFCVNGKDGNAIVREISIAATDATTLLIDFLSEVLTRSYEEGAIFCRIDFLKMDETAAKAKIYGKRAREFKEDIKAVTYHEAEVKRNEDEKWETVIVFDI